MAARSDLLVEADTILDGSGHYEGDWLDSGGVTRVAVIAVSSGSGPDLRLDQGADGSTADWSPSFPASGELPVVGRYFRLRVAGGTPNATFVATLRRLA